MNAFIKYFGLYVIWYPFRSIVRTLTVRRGVYRRLLTLGSFLGLLFYLLFSPGRKIIRKELENLDLYRRGEVRKTFQHIMKIEMEGMVFEDLDVDLIKEITVLEGLGHLDRCIQLNRGTVLALFHFGWHMHTIPALGFLGYKIYQIADPRPVDLQRRMGFFHRRVVEKRLANAENLPVTFVMAGSYLRPVMRLLEKENVFIVALDGREAKNFNAYPFLGKKILLSPVMLKMAVKTGSPVLPMLTFRGEDGKHRVIIHPEIESDDPDQMMIDIVRIFEDYVRERPHQYAQYLFSNALRAIKDKEGAFTLIVS